MNVTILSAIPIKKDIIRFTVMTNKDNDYSKMDELTYPVDDLLYELAIDIRTCMDDSGNISRELLQEEINRMLGMLKETSTIAQKLEGLTWRIDSNE